MFHGASQNFNQEEPMARPYPLPPPSGVEGENSAHPLTSKGCPGRASQLTATRCLSNPHPTIDLAQAAFPLLSANALKPEVSSEKKHLERPLTRRPRHPQAAESPKHFQLDLQGKVADPCALGIGDHIS